MIRLGLSFIIAATLWLGGPASAPTAPPATTSTTTTVPPPLVSPTDMAQWGKVAWCETHGNWHRDASNYDGGLGISRTNWVTFGGLRFAPAPHLATPEEQVFIAKRINAGYDVPDQDGNCEAW